MKNVGEHLLPAVAYGDALGLPVETQTAAAIYKEHGRITRLIDVTGNPYFESCPKGTWSDDTQLSLAVAASLLKEDAFDLKTIAAEHIKAYQTTTRGWGGSTKASVERLIAGTHGPQESGEINGQGNGVLIKLAPLVFWQISRSVAADEARVQIEQLTRMTHNNDETVLASYVYADILRWLAVADPSAGNKTALLARMAESFEYHRPAGAPARPLGELIGALKAVDNWTPPAVLRVTDGRGFVAAQTLAMALGAFLVEDRFPLSVQTAVNLGGDTDSVGSIVGALSAFYHGKITLPEDYVYIQDRERIDRLSRRLGSLV